MHYFLVDKPYGTLSQFTREAPHHRTLGDLYDFPPTVYPVGRLDRDSEGLLLLTDDKRLNAALLHPDRKLPKTYWVRVEGAPSADQLAALRRGPTIRVGKRDHRCAPATVRPLDEADTATLPPRTPPVRYRKSVPDAWLALTITEGKNRQVRRMCAAVGLPVLRLVRTAIGGLDRAALEGAAVRKLEFAELARRLPLRS